MRAGAAIVRGTYDRRTWRRLPRAPRVRSVLSGKEVVMPHMRRLTAAQRERHAMVAAALVRRVVEEACNQGNYAVLDEALAPLGTSAPLDPGSERPGALPGGLVGDRLPGLLVAFRAAVPDARWTIVEQVAALRPRRLLRPAAGAGAARP